MTFPAVRRTAAGREVRRTAVIGLVVGVGVALVPAVAPAVTPAATPPAPAMVARTDSELAVETLDVPVADGAARSAGVSAELPPTTVEPFALVGVTWRPGTMSAANRVEVRLRDGAGWGGWQPLTWDPDEGPAPGEDSSVREGTGPLWVGEADGVAMRVLGPTGATPRQLQVVTVDPGDEPAAGTTARTSARSPAGPHPQSGNAITRSPRFPAKPRVISRRQWGADPSLTDRCDSPRYGRSANMVFVHHTVNSNQYSPRESPAIVRSIYAYHTQGQNWCDIGYNALVDRFGNIYAGRRGGINKPVRGAHAGDYNTGTVGVSLIGNFQQRRPSARMMNALVRFVGWRLGTSYKPVRGTVRISGASFKRISGHRDAMSTACPGRYVYHRLPSIRARTADYLRRYDSALARKAKRLGRSTTGAVWIGERAANGGFRTVFNRGVMLGKKGLGAHLLRGRLLDKFRHTGSADGVLGWPTTDVRRTQVGHARVMAFRHGRIYLIRGTSPKVVYGGIFQRYRKTGLAQGRLGLPRTNTQRNGAVRRVDFRHGTIWWNAAKHKTRVKFR